VKSFAKRREKKEGVSCFLFSLFFHRLSHSIYIYACFGKKVAEFEKNQGWFLLYRENREFRGSGEKNSTLFYKK